MFSLSHLPNVFFVVYLVVGWCVCFVGGVTFSEIRTVYELSAKLKKDIVIVSTHLLTPGVMIDSLVKLGGDNHDADDDNSDDDTDSSEES